MAAMENALAQVAAELPAVLDTDVIERTCRRLGHRWRRRVLDPVNTVSLLVLQMLHRNTACSHLPHLSGKRFTASAYCQARRRLPLGVMTALLDRTASAARSATSDVGLWLGHRKFLIDGSACSMPDTPRHANRFGKPSGHRPGVGFPMGHLLAILDGGTGLLAAIRMSPFRTSDTAHMPGFCGYLGPGDILVGDRAFDTFTHLALLTDIGAHGVFRLHRAVNTDFTPNRPFRHPSKPSATYKGWPRSRWIRALGPDDQLVEYFRPRRRSAVLDDDAWDALPESIIVRELRYSVEQPGFRTRVVVLVTTLTDAERYPKAELIELYRRRWQAEIDLRHLKQTLGMSMLKCRQADGVEKELAAFALAYNLLRLAMLKAARARGVSPDRVSFIDTIRWMQNGAREGMSPQLVINPERHGRIEPRALKRGRNRYPWMTRPRDALRQQAILRCNGP